MSQQLTITISDEVYRGLQQAAGKRTISELIEELARPIMVDSMIEASYREMSLDREREQEASEWIEGLVHDPLAGGPHAAR